jgi:hypothetical protein
MRIIREKGVAGLFYATSPDLKGFLAVGKTLEDLESAIPLAIENLRIKDVHPSRSDNFVKLTVYDRKQR